MDPFRNPEEEDYLLEDLYEVYFPPRDEEMFHVLNDWLE